MRLYESDITKAVLESTSMIIAELETGEILWASQVMESMFGYPIVGELVGKNVDDLVPDAVRGKHKSHREGYAKTPHRRGMGAKLLLQGRRYNGTLFPVEIYLTPRVISGVKCVVAKILDQTDRA